MKQDDGHKCDRRRCGVRQGYIPTHQVLHFSRENGGWENSYDLCDSCWSQFNTWFLKYRGKCKSCQVPMIKTEPIGTTIGIDINKHRLCSDCAKHLNRWLGGHIKRLFPDPKEEEQSNARALSRLNANITQYQQGANGNGHHQRVFAPGLYTP